MFEHLLSRMGKSAQAIKQRTDSPFCNLHILDSLETYFDPNRNRFQADILKNFKSLVSAGDFNAFPLSSSWPANAQKTWDMNKPMDAGDWGDIQAHPNPIESTDRRADGSADGSAGGSAGGNTNTGPFPVTDWRECVAWYCPAHFHGPDSYGIHMSKHGLASVTEGIRSMCSSVQPLEVVLAAVIYTFFAHELCHAWIENLCCMIDSSNDNKAPKGQRSYAVTHCKFNGYIYMEEAICNTAAFGWLQNFLRRKQSSSQDIASFIPRYDSEIILAAFETFMRDQPAGYRRFLAIDQIPCESQIFRDNVWRLLMDVYLVDPAERDAVRRTIRIFQETTPEAQELFGDFL